MHRSDTARLYALDRRLRNRISIFAKVVFDSIFIFSNLVGPDGAAILKMNDVGRRGQRHHQRQHHKH